jgi:hypothetical protein
MPAMAAATTTFEALRIIDIDRPSSLCVRATSNSPAALVMPADEACFDQEEYAIEGVAEDRQREEQPAVGTVRHRDCTAISGGKDCAIQSAFAGSR